MYSIISDRMELLSKNFVEISAERKAALQILADAIKEQQSKYGKANLVFICTHNSGRSQLGQIWAAVAAHFYHREGIETFSAGTEVDAFNPKVIDVLQHVGFNIQQTSHNANPHYILSFAEANTINAFSKLINDEVNPSKNFISILTCSDAESNCPIVPGSDKRIILKYSDPRRYKNSSLENEKFTERSNQIAQEMLYVMSIIE